MDIPAIRVHNSRRPAGFTLLEMVMTILLIGILGITGISMLYDPFVTAKSVNATNTDASKARYIMERVIRELREAEVNSNCSITISGSSVTFRTSNGLGACSGTQNTIALSGNNLTLNGTVISNNVTTFTPTYTSAERRVTIVLTVADTTYVSASSSNASSLRSEIYLRNNL